MSGHRPFAELTQGFSKERRDRVDAIKAALNAEMPLHQLRQALMITQNDLAEQLQIKQPAVSKLEQRTDMYISSLRSYIEAAGGKLKIVAEFPEGEVMISNFSHVGATDGVR